MAVDAVVGGVELALEEPGIVAVGEAAGVDGLEVAGPGEEIPGLPGPELFGLGYGLFVEGLVFLDAWRRRMGLVGGQRNIKEGGWRDRIR